jgi:hypothetical protein
MAFFAVANFVKFFQQFAIDIAVRHFYSFALDGELLCLTTVPTGGVGPPLLAEALTRTICAAAVRLLGHQDVNSVIYDTMIDNVRFVSDSAELLLQVWHNFIDICARVGITMGEVTPPSCTNGQTEYVFLGLSFRQLCVVTAGPKLGDKLARAVVLLSSAGEFAVLDWLAVFGVLYRRRSCMNRLHDSTSSSSSSAESPAATSGSGRPTPESGRASSNCGKNGSRH